MSNISKWSLALASGLALVLSAACGTAGQPVHCGPANCDGCCDALGTCVPGVGPGACGASGAQCQACAAPQVCTAYAGTTTQGGHCGAAGTGGGGGVGGGPGGTGGSAGTGGALGTGGGAGGCSAMTCASGCCTGAGTCVATPTSSHCGAGGNVCVVCTAGNVCTGGACVPCAGCVELSTGQCLAGQDDAFCGQGGAFCQACDTSSGQSCQGGLCVGGAAGGGTGTGGSAGGTGGSTGGTGGGADAGVWPAGSVTVVGQGRQLPPAWVLTDASLLAADGSGAGAPGHAEELVTLNAALTTSNVPCPLPYTSGTTTYCDGFNATAGGATVVIDSWSYLGTSPPCKTTMPSNGKTLSTVTGVWEPTTNATSGTASWALTLVDCAGVGKGTAYAGTAAAAPSTDLHALLANFPPLGTTVTVSGVVVATRAAASTGSFSFVIEDPAGGLASGVRVVRAKGSLSTAVPPALGDQVTVTATVGAATFHELHL